MHLVPTEEQDFLARTARDFGAKQSPPERMRTVRDTGEWNRDLWQEMVKLGWTGVHLPEDVGGSALGFADLCMLIEELGRTLTPEPLISSAAVCASGIDIYGSDEQKSKHLPEIISGDVLAAFAHDEKKARHRDFFCQTEATRTDAGFKLVGTKVPVPDACHADLLIVSARTSGDGDDRAGLTLFLVDADTEGLDVEPLNRIDGRDCGRVVLDSVHVSEDAVLGEIDSAADRITALLDRGRIALAAEMVGAAQAAFDMTLSYLKERVQFGVPIGSFQALQHRAAKLLSDIELARTAVLAAAQAVDQEPERIPELASLAKAKCNDMFVHVANEGIQMHGGIGVTDEHDIGLYLKRARVAKVTWGDSAFHRRRWATLRGY
jgi:acyl-CoA dehydrogenase